jgi:hypothetical protein
MNPTQQTRFEPAPGVMCQGVGGEMVLLVLESDQCFGLNEVGAQVWQMLNEGLTQEEMIGRLLERYEVSREQLANDVSVLLSSLADRRLIVPLTDG